MILKVETSSEEPNLNPSNQGSRKKMICFLISSRIAMTNVDIDFLIYPSMFHGTYTYTFRKTYERVTKLMGAITYLSLEAPNICSRSKHIDYWFIVFLRWLQISKFLHFKNIFPVALPSTAFPETIPRDSRCSILDSIRSKHMLRLVFWW